MRKLTIEEINLLVSGLFFGKALVFGVSAQECIGLFIVLLSLHAERIINHIYPKRVDLHTEFALMSARLSELQVKIDDHERDLTSLKFSTARLR